MSGEAAAGGEARNAWDNDKGEAGVAEGDHNVAGAAERAPRWVQAYARKTLDAPCTVYLSGLFVTFLLVAGCGLAPNLTLSDATGYDWTISTTPASENRDAYNFASRDVDSPGASTTDPTSGDLATRSEASETLMFTYAYADGRVDTSVFTPDNLVTMCEIENVLLKHPEYPNFCVLDEAGLCKKQSASILEFFYFPSSWEEEAGVGYVSRNCSKSAQLNNADARNNFIQLVENPTTRLGVGFYAGENTLDDGFTPRTRSVLSCGGPLEGFPSTEDPTREQGKKYRKFFTSVESNLFEFFQMKETPISSPYRDTADRDQLNVNFVQGHFYQAEFDRVINGDLTWALLSISFVFVYMSVHTGSIILGGTGILHIVLSLPVGFFFYGTCFRIPYIAQIHVLATFLALGVGADDMFVYVDAWKQLHYSLHRGARELDSLVASYERTKSAVFNTSFTTAVAFGSTALSPIMPISSFGMFAALVIIVNYVMVITLTPAIVIWWDRKTRRAKISDICATSNDASSPSGELDAPTEAASATSSALDIENAGPTGSKEEEEELLEEKLGLIERFLAVHYANALSTRCGGLRLIPILIVLGFIGWVSSAAYFAFQLVPPTQSEQWFPNNHMFTGIDDYLGSKFLASEDDNYLDVQVVWGISGIDRADFNRFIPDLNRGTVIFDDSFDLTDKAAQDSIFAACERIRTTVCTVPGCSGGGLNRLSLKDEDVRCFIEDYRDWYRGRVGDDSADIPANSTLLDSLKEFRAGRRDLQKNIGFIGGHLKYVSVTFKSSLLDSQPHSITKPVYHECEHLKDAIIASAPATANTVIQVTDGSWAWLNTEEGLVNGMFLGMAIAFPCAFFVLVLATHNIIVAFYAVSTVGAIVVCVLGFVQHFMGWNLGVAETIASTIVIGLSVDYALHLGHSYVDAPFRSREDRTKFALRSMGITVFAGAITTFGSGSVMLLCQLTFFTKMAVLLSSTIAFSFVASLGFFMSLCSLVGPEGSTGNINFHKLFAGKSAAPDQSRQTKPGTEPGKKDHTPVVELTAKEARTVG